jgi:hypothetical protein
MTQVRPWPVTMMINGQEVLVESWEHREQLLGRAVRTKPEPPRTPEPETSRSDPKPRREAPEPARPDPELLFESAADILNGSSETFVPIIQDLAFRGLKTLLVGQSKAGKSFTTWAKVGEVVAGGGSVIYLSEEPRAAIGDKLKRFGLIEAPPDRFLVLRRTADKNGLRSWGEVVQAIASRCEQVSVDLVVVDTARPWFKLSGDESNSADVIGRAFDSLSEVTEQGTAILVLHQAPWSSTRARGSTEFHASADLIFHVDGQADGPRTVRFVGGRVDTIPAIQTFRWDGQGHVESLGKARADRAVRMDEVLTLLERSPEPMSVDEVAEAIDCSRKTAERTIRQLEGQGLVTRIPGRINPGRGSEPDRFRRAGRFSSLLAISDSPEAPEE